ncbi:hypothetical protein FRC04_000902 [Tulasnella sp. 424]|nr:hypothetical protein FRC04_000902 [Tulasnella sp. 424]KAG8977820.1 hypothetical protein FRC05_000347 [Tulasnella sp. 425]
MPSTTSFQSQQQAVDSQRHRSPPPPAQSSSADQIPHPHHHQQHHHQQSYATTSTPQQYAAYYASHHHQHSALVDHPTDGTPLHDPQAQQQSLQQEQHPLVDSEGLAAAELLAAFPQSPATPSSPDVSSLPQQAAAALTAQEAASADASHSLHQSTAQAIALPFPPPGSVPIAYFAGPNGSIIAIPQLKAKRRQVKNACTNCQKACKKCDEVRPCTRCVKYGIDKDCVDSQRKERKKGIKRGPYKKREPKDLEEEDPTLPQGSANLAATHILTPDTAAAFQAIGGTVIYSYTPTMVQSGGNGSATSSPSNLPQSPVQQHPPQASSSSSPSSSAQQHIQLQPAMLPAQMQFQKAPDGTLQYPPQQYYIATQPVVAASGSGMEENANGDGGSSSAGAGSSSSAQQVQIQQHAFPLQYFGQMAYAGFPTGYVVQQPGSIYQIAPSAMQSTTSHHQHHSAASNDDPIERQNQHQHQGPLPPTLNSSPNGGKGKGKSIESRKKVAAATLAAAQQEMEQRSRAGGGGGPE